MLNLLLLTISLFFVFLLLLLLFGAIITLYSFLYLYIENRTNEQAKTITIHIPLIVYLKKYLFEACCINLKFLLFPLKFVHMYKNLDIANNLASSSVKPNKNLVILVHGYGRTQTDWLWFQHNLAKEISDPICAVNNWPTLGSIQQIAEVLKARIENLQVLTGCNTVTLIGHSMGGLVCSYLSEYGNDVQAINKVILLGSPLHGTKLAVLGYGTNARQMEPGSKFLTELLTKIKSSKKSYYNVVSKLDNMVIPWGSALIAADATDVSRQLILPLASHQELIYSRQVLAQIKTWLT